MGIQVEAINHVGLVVKDRAAAEAFYLGVLGLRRPHRMPSWLILNDRSTLHLINIPDAPAESSPSREMRHFALQVPDRREVLKLLLGHGIEPFQADFAGNRKPVTTPDAPLDFGVGTLFVHDPDGTLSSSSSGEAASSART
jgi:catechol 2,3-dioxygenase-like lactoylglutathione lyase family enzyme